MRGREGTFLGHFPEVVDVLMASLPETATGREGQLEGRGRRFPLGGLRNWHKPITGKSWRTTELSTWCWIGGTGISATE